MKTFLFHFAVAGITWSTLPNALPQGSIVPTTAPNVPIMKTLDQVEPRTLIKSLPFTIAASGDGSYYLSSTLTAGPSGNGITVSASNVTIDLNGFALVGNGGANSGIFISGGISNVTVRNGTIRNWGGAAVNGTGNAHMRVENVVARNNAAGGLLLDQSAAVLNCAGDANTNFGIIVADGSVVKDTRVAGTIGGPGSGLVVNGWSSAVERCVATNNVGTGIICAANGNMNGCSATGNSLGGITTGTGWTLHNCSANANSGNGIRVGDSSSLLGCTANSNTSTAATSTGILTGKSCALNNCTASSNTNTTASAAAGVGISTGPNTTVTNCVATGNSGDGIAVGDTSSVMGTNANGNGSGAIGSGIHAVSAAVIRNCTASSNHDRGIRVSFTCLVIDNVVTNNGVGVISAGIDSANGNGSGNRIEANQVWNTNGVGIRFSTSDFIMRNVAGANTTNANRTDYTPTNNTFFYFGPIENPNTSTHPPANYEF